MFARSPLATPTLKQAFTHARTLQQPVKHQYHHHHAGVLASPLLTPYPASPLFSPALYSTYFLPEEAARLPITPPLRVPGARNVAYPFPGLGLSGVDAPAPAPAPTPHAIPPSCMRDKTVTQADRRTASVVRGCQRPALRLDLCATVIPDVDSVAYAMNAMSFEAGPSNVHISGFRSSKEHLDTPYPGKQTWLEDSDGDEEWYDVCL